MKKIYLKACALSAVISVSNAVPVVAVTLLTLTHSKNANATGIPTVDIAALVQKLLQYVQELNDFAEQLYQSKVIANEYVQTLKDIEQTYTEYEHTLEQIKGLKDFVDDKEWQQILSRIDLDFPLDPFDSHWDDWGLSILTDDGVIDVDQTIGRVYKRIRPIDQVESDIDKIYSDPDVRDQQRAEARAQFKKSREVTEQKYSAKAFSNRGEQLKEAEDQLSTYREEIGTEDETELRSIQFLAMQQELSLRYQGLQNEVLVKSLDMANQESVERKTKESYVYDNHLMDKLETQENSKYTKNPTRTRTIDF